MTPLPYDAIPGSWAIYSTGWPSLVVPQQLVDEAAKINPQHARHVAHKHLCRAAGIPYGSYVTVGDELRVETEEMKATILIAIGQKP